MRKSDNMLELLLILILLMNRRSRNKEGMHLRTDVILTLANH